MIVIRFVTSIVTSMSLNPELRKVRMLDFVDSLRYAVDLDIKKKQS